MWIPGILEDSFCFDTMAPLTNILHIGHNCMKLTTSYVIMATVIDTQIYECLWMLWCLLIESLQSSNPAPEQRRSSLQCSRVSTDCIEVPNIPPCFKSLIRSLLVQLLQLLLTRSANHRLRGLGKPLSLVAEWIRMIRRIISLPMPPQSIPRVFSAKLGGHAPDHEEMDFTVLPLHSAM